ncbi:nitrate- and nitrite sensing domain-containing protein [Actinokineospora sp. 24-640]
MTVAALEVDQQKRGRPSWTAVADWRNWRLPVKLAAVLVVPVLVAIGAGALQIQGYVARSANYAQMRDLVAVRTALIPLTASVQQERTMVARGVPEPEVFQTRGRTSETLRLRLSAASAATTGFGEVSANRYYEAAKLLDGLPAARVADPTTAITAYTLAVKALLDFDQALVSQFGDPLLSGTATALHHAEVAREQVTLQQAVVLAGIRRGKLLGAEIRTLAESSLRLSDRESDFQAVATPRQNREYQARMEAGDVAVRDGLALSAVNAGGAIAIEPAEWSRVSETTAALLSDVVSDLATELRTTADRLQDQTSDRAGLASVVLLGMLFAAGAIGWVVGRQLLRSLGALRRAALEVADHRLPAVVAGIRANAAPDTHIEPVPVHTTDELGQLARAFDAVHRQAVHSATEQAELRSDMRNIFVNLSRRSQGLVERQLKLMEDLERKEEDPDQLANLFKLDHLATRMRRNNENLMVLSGTEVSRRFTRPVPLVSVLRAAVSEIEQYQRVVLRPAPPVEVVGYAAGDLVHLVAELLDNATAFSPPRARVVVGAQPHPEGGVLVEVVDEGVGMAEAELAAVNRRLAEDAPTELPVSRQLGLFVVARLAARQGVRVRVQETGLEHGLRASVLVPAELVRTPAVRVAPAAPPAPARPPVPTVASVPAAKFTGSGGQDPAWFGSALPKRPTRSVSAFAAPSPTAARRRDPERVRGFLTNYQSGARRSAPEANHRNEQS